MCARQTSMYSARPDVGKSSCESVIRSTISWCCIAEPNAACQSGKTACMLVPSLRLRIVSAQKNMASNLFSNLAFGKLSGFQVNVLVLRHCDAIRFRDKPVVVRSVRVGYIAGEVHPRDLKRRLRRLRFRLDSVQVQGCDFHVLRRVVGGTRGIARKRHRLTLPGGASKQVAID